MSAVAVRPPLVARLLAGPPASSGQETLGDHEARLGPRPIGGLWVLDALARSGLRGRGGALFPTARKWSTVAGLSTGRSVVVVNASEGEPLSSKDRALVSQRPHLVLDGAALAAESVGAEEIIVYLSRPAGDAIRAVRRAIRERTRQRLAEPPMRIVRTAHRYVAGESSAVVRRIGGGQAKPMFTPPHPSECGVNRQPTLIQNPETLAHAALIARHGPEWFRECGTYTSPGSFLMTLSGNVRYPGVYEVDPAAHLDSVLAYAGGTISPPAGALLGGYFGTWIPPEVFAQLALDADSLDAHSGASMGCGILAVLPDGACGIAETARIVAYLARESAGQCGPCVFGLRSISGAMGRIAASNALPDDAQRVLRWGAMARGRGACRHPDGAVRHLESALAVFADHLALHLAGWPCPSSRSPAIPPPPRHGGGWR